MTGDGWRLGDFDSHTPLWWEVVADTLVKTGGSAVGYIQLSPAQLLTLVDVHLKAGFAVVPGGSKSWMPCKTYYFITSPDRAAGVNYRMMGRGEYEAAHSVVAAGPARADREQTARIAVNRDRTAALLTGLAAEIQAMKRRAGVVA